MLFLIETRKILRCQVEIQNHVEALAFQLGYSLMTVIQNLAVSCLKVMPPWTMCLIYEEICNMICTKVLAVCAI